MGDTLEETIAAARFNLEAAEPPLTAGDGGAAAYPLLIALELAVDCAAEVAHLRADPEGSPHQRRRALARELEARGIATKGTGRLLARLDYLRTSGYRGEAPGPEALDVAHRAVSATTGLLAWLDARGTPGQEMEIDVGAEVQSARLAHEREVAALEAKAAKEARLAAEALEEESRGAAALAASTERAEATIATFLSVALPAGCPGVQPVRLVDSSDEGKGRTFRTVPAWLVESAEHPLALRPDGDLRRLRQPGKEMLEVADILGVDPDELYDDELEGIGGTGADRAELAGAWVLEIDRTQPPLHGDEVGRAARAIVRGIARIVAREGLPWPEQGLSPPYTRSAWPVVWGGQLALAQAPFVLVAGLIPLLAATTEPSVGLFGWLVLGYAVASLLGRVAGGFACLGAPVIAGLGLAAAAGIGLLVGVAALHAVLGLAATARTAVSGPWDRFPADSALLYCGLVGGGTGWVALVADWIGLI